MGVGITISNVYLFPLVIGCLEVSGRSFRTYRFAIGSLFRREAWRRAGLFFFWGGGGGEIMSTDKIPFWREGRDLERRVMLGMCTKHFVVWNNHAGDKVGNWVQLVLVKSITLTLGSAWYDCLPHQETPSRLSKLCYFVSNIS